MGAGIIFSLAECHSLVGTESRKRIKPIFSPKKLKDSHTYLVKCAI